MLQLSSIPSIELGRLMSEVWSIAQTRSGMMPVRPNHLTYGGVAEAMLDHTFTLAMNAMTGIPDRGHMAKQRLQMHAARELFERRGWLDEPESFHRDPAPVKQWKLASRRTRLPSRLDYSQLSFPSSYQPRRGLPESGPWMKRNLNRTHYADILQHDDVERPWLVCVHGFGMGTAATNFTGFAARWLHEELGLNLIFPTLPLHGGRTASTVSGAELLRPDYLALVHSFAQAVWDIRRTVSWLRDRGATKIGLYGLSLGGCNSALVASLEDDLECVIAGIPMVDFSRVARENAPWVVDWYHASGNDWALLNSVMRVVSPLAMQPRVPCDRRFIFAGRADRVVPPDHARSLWSHWQQPDIHWYPGGHVFGFMTEDVREFVKSSLQSSAMLDSRCS